jgi:hypothetical protein
MERLEDCSNDNPDQQTRGVDLPVFKGFLSNLTVLQFSEFNSCKLPAEFPEMASAPQFSLGSRCRWIPNPNTDWGTVIGHVYIPTNHDRASSEWSWLYLLLLDVDSPSRQWVAVDWVGEEDLELLPSPPERSREG